MKGIRLLLFVSFSSITLANIITEKFGPDGKIVSFKYTPDDDTLLKYKRAYGDTVRKRATQNTRRLSGWPMRLCSTRLPMHRVKFLTSVLCWS